MEYRNGQVLQVKRSRDYQRNSNVAFSMDRLIKALDRHQKKNVSGTVVEHATFLQGQDSRELTRALDGMSASATRVTLD